jgi:transcriptional regulator with XRE-family HTH domain
MLGHVKCSSRQTELNGLFIRRSSGKSANHGVGDIVALVKRAAVSSEQEIDPKAVGERLRALRAGLSMSQTAVASALGVAKTTYADWEIGLRLPTVEAAYRLQFQFNVDIDWLFWGGSPEPCRPIAFHDIWEAEDRLLGLANNTNVRIALDQRRKLIEDILQRPPSQQEVAYHAFEVGIKSGVGNAG